MTQPTAFLLWADIPAGNEDGFNEWYNREHAPDRVLGIGGFLQARRFAAVEGGPRHAVLYEVADPAVFRDEAYLSMRRTPDARSQQFIPLFHNVMRFVGRPLAEARAAPGVIEGAWARVAAVRANVSTNDARAWQAFFDALVGRPGILRARLFRADTELMSGAVKNMQGTTREGLRGPDRLPDAVVMAESATEEQAAAIEVDVTAAIAARPGWMLLDSARMRQVMRVAPNRQGA